MGTYIEGVASVLGAGGVAVAIITWLRYRGNDRAKAHGTEATGTKVLSEAYEVKMRTEMTIAAEWRKIADEFKKQLYEEREECIRDMDKMREHYDHKLNKQQGEINLLREEINTLQSNGKH